MDAENDHVVGAKRNQDFRSLPRDVRLDDIIASVEAHRVQDPDAVRNADQHRALSDD